MKTCRVCGRTLTYDKFYPDKRVKDGCQSWCKECVLKYRKAHRQRNTEIQMKCYQKVKDFVRTYKTHCAKCGIDKYYVLQFHHKDPSTKSFNVGSARHSIEATKREIEKCVCLCSNCHDTFHYFYGNNPTHPMEALEEFLSPHWTPHDEIKSSH